MSKFNELLINASTKEELEEIASLAKARLKEIEQQEYPDTCCKIIQDIIDEIKSGNIYDNRMHFDKTISFPYSKIVYDPVGASIVNKGPRRVELNIVYEVK